MLSQIDLSLFIKSVIKEETLSLNSVHFCLIASATSRAFALISSQCLTQITMIAMIAAIAATTKAYGASTAMVAAASAAFAAIKAPREATSAAFIAVLTACTALYAATAPAITPIAVASNPNATFSNPIFPSRPGNSAISWSKKTCLIWETRSGSAWTIPLNA